MYRRIELVFLPLPRTFFSDVCLGAISLVLLDCFDLLMLDAMAGKRALCDGC
jgi:hypothetical protein